MLVPAIVEPILLYGGIGLLALTVVVFSVLRDERHAKEASAGNLPEANVVGSTRARFRGWLPWAMLVIGGLMIYVSWKHATDVIVVSDDGTTLSATRKVRLFGSSDYPLAPGVREAQDWMSDPTWVLNESSRPVKVKTVNYGRTLGWGNDPTVISPGTAAAFSRIEHVGPGDSPPTQVQDKFKLGMDSRHWLVWGGE